jgi:hypothetical protein
MVMNIQVPLNVQKFTSGFLTTTQLHGVGQLVKELTTTVHSIIHMWLVQLWLICTPLMSIYKPVEFAWRFCPTVYIHEITRELLDRFS